MIGAGLAGLVAADELARAGAEVVVLEARSRAGGRVWSERLPGGAVIEMGAEYILPGNTAVRELVDRFGLGLWDKGMRYGRRDPRGGIGTTHEELTAATETLEAELVSGTRANASAEELLDSIDIPAGAREAILARVEISCASTADRVAAADLAGVAHIDDEPSPSIAGGNGRLPLALAEELGGAVRLGDPATLVEWGDGVRVATASGHIGADACIVAVPASVLDAIVFDPLLPDAVRSALGLVEYGHAAKLFVPLRAPAVPSAVMNVPERYWTWTATGADDAPQPVVSAFAGSTPRARTAGRGVRSEPLARFARTSPHRPGARHGRRRALDMGRRPLGPGRLLHDAAARGRGGRERTHRPARLRRRAHRRRAPRFDGGRDQERAARRSLAVAPVTSR